MRESVCSRALLHDPSLPVLPWRQALLSDCALFGTLRARVLTAALFTCLFIFTAGNESCPQPQTSEHLAAIEIMKLKHIIILQNKIDLMKESQAKDQYEQIQKFVQGTVAEKAPVIPISAQLKYNIEVICEYIVTKIPIPVRDFTSSPRLIVIRSFDVNKPGSEVEDLKGGVAGGSILRGVLQLDMVRALHAVQSVIARAALMEESLFLRTFCTQNTGPARAVKCVAELR